ncbi:tyrosine-protein phosphatase [Sutcliffiella rhizosphaerae]|uniref:Tyrosine-protein phosphatase n=1 Tax=Sutcliffiella rhizosphaerae TaxID=2880967 RepID=A0ABN8A8F4_9BACI|nr:CpsB/CapC family capsule biosynthesis tyrosine phosphatase [Sutcliffiella rhizosphaerae]CAG9621390.1 Tyrosine-protein phosphatase YwqE [Sutcliffiella rhizosphaerae]
MIDIHCHILPSVDDGAKHMTESLEMARAAEKEGITAIVATPHHNNGQYMNTKLDIMEKVKELNGRIQKEGIDITILPGQECRISGEMLDQLDREELLTMNDKDKYIFVELPSSQVPLYTEQIIYDIQLKGITPIIVHPERNAELIENPEKLYQLVKNGACTQVTAASVVGKFGKKIKKFAIDMIEANLTHFVASDAHNLKNRSFQMSEAYKIIEKECGSDATYLLMENAELLVEGSMIIKEIPERIKKKKLFGLIG